MRRNATAFELEFAKDLGGRRVFLSGAGAVKADVRRQAVHRRVGDDIVMSPQLAFRGEAKTTMVNGYTLSAQTWTDLVNAAAPAGEIPIFAVRFLNNGPATLAVVRVDFAKELFLVSHSLTSTGLVAQRSVLLRPGAERQFELLRMPASLGRSDVLSVHPYPRFIEALHGHPDFQASPSDR